MSDDEVTIKLSRDQALVLSHWLYTVMGTRSFDSIVDEDPAVWSALYRIRGAVDAEPLIFARDYGERLDEARGRLCSELGEEFVASRTASKDGDQAAKIWLSDYPSDDRSAHWRTSMDTSDHEDRKLEQSGSESA